MCAYSYIYLYTLVEAYILVLRTLTGAGHVAKGKRKVPPGCLFGGAGHLCHQIFHAPGARLWHYATELRTLSVTYPLCCSALTDSTDNPSEMFPLKLTDFCLFLYHWSYTILQGPLIPPMAFTSCHDRGSSRLPPDGRASTLTTQPLRLHYSQ